MGVPKRLTNQQIKFANLLVAEQGRKTATQCAIEAGYAKDSARQAASVLQNPKKYPLVVQYIGELREEWQKQYEVTCCLSCRLFCITCFDSALRCILSTLFRY